MISRLGGPKTEEPTRA